MKKGLEMLGGTFVLDEFHLRKYVRRMAHAGGEEEKEEELMREIEKGEKKKVREWAEERSVKVGEKERKRLEESLGYLERNWKGIWTRVKKVEGVMGSSTEGHISHVLSARMSSRPLQKKWDGLKRIVLEIPFSPASIKIDMGDSRFLNCRDDTATLLITSPPYINVFNYHQKYRRSVEALGYDVLAIAKNEFGSNRKNRGNRLLTVIQYCIDMALSFKEVIRTCRDGARMIYVVGRESNVLGYSFCNSRLIFEIATQIFEIPFLLRQERVFKNRFGQLIYEDILHFENSKTGFSPSDEEIVSSARSIAVKMLFEKAQMYPDSKNIGFIVEAIEKSEKINRSEA